MENLRTEGNMETGTPFAGETMVSCIMSHFDGSNERVDDIMTSVSHCFTQQLAWPQAPKRSAHLNVV